MRPIRSLTASMLLGSSVLWNTAPAAAAAADVDPPVVTSTGLQDGQDIGRSRRLFPSWTDDTGVTTVELLLNGTVVRTHQPGKDAAGIYLPVPARLHGTDATVTVRAFDAAGNKGEATSRVRVDGQDPQVTMSPPFESFVSGVVTFTATDLSGDLAQVSLHDHATGREVARSTAAPWTMTWDTTGRNGAAHMHVQLTDKAGNVALVHGFYAVDNSAPTVHRVEVAPQPGDTVLDGRISGRTRLTAVVDDRSSLDRIEWWVDGTLRSINHYPTDSGSYPSPWFDWDTGTANRTARLEVRAYDIHGRHATLTRDIVLDNTGPAITSMTPAHRALVRGAQFRATVTATDDSGIREAQLRDASVINQAPFTLLTPSGRDGARTLTWTLTDHLGNNSTAQRVVIVDNTKPTVRITKAPANRAKVKKTVKITVAAADRNGVNRVELLVNGKVVARDVTAAYSFSVNPKKYGKKFKVQIRVYDKAGNISTTPTRTWQR